MGLKETARKIAAAPAELASNQKRTVPPPPQPAPYQPWTEQPEEEDPRRIEGQRALAHSALYQRPTVEELEEQQRQENAVAAAWMTQRGR